MLEVDLLRGRRRQPRTIGQIRAADAAEHLHLPRAPRAIRLEDRVAAPALLEAAWQLRPRDRLTGIPGIDQRRVARVGTGDGDPSVGKREHVRIEEPRGNRDLGVDAE